MMISTAAMQKYAEEAKVVLYMIGGPYGDYWVAAGCPLFHVVQVESVVRALPSLAVVMRERAPVVEEPNAASFLLALTDAVLADMYREMLARLMIRAFETPRYLALVRVPQPL